VRFALKSTPSIGRRAQFLHLCKDEKVLVYVSIEPSPQALSRSINSQ